MFKRSTSRTNSKENPIPGRTVGTGWMVLGGTVALVGVVLGVQKLLPGPVGELAASARDYGLEAGSLAVGGLVLVAVGSAARALTRRAAQPNDDALLLEQVANDLLIVKDALEQSTESTQRVTDEVRMLQSSVGSLAESQNAVQQHLMMQQQQPQAQPGNNDDAIFRLAASLDQLGARVEQRMKAQYGEMQASLDELNAVVASVRRNVDELFQGVHDAAASAEPAPAKNTQPQVSAPRAPIVVTEPPRAALPVEPAPRGVPLGLLDQLDDPMAPMPMPMHAPQMQLAHAEPVHAEASAHAPLAHDDTDDKLAELRSLLTDERLRAALEQMRRTA
ncbi:MAG: hypothetical protein IT453_08095 [Planctomycetes bacterium]|nr:hypothetical protein [Planctomycetota bacterium]